MSNFFKTDHATPEQIAQMNEQVFSNPEVQQALAEYNQRYGPNAGYHSNRANLPAINKLNSVLKRAGLPDNMSLTPGPDGQPTLKDTGGINWGNIVALGIGATAGGFALAGAFGAGGGTTVGSTAAGAGGSTAPAASTIASGAALPSETIGLGGSSFAGEAGGIGASTVLPSGASAAIPTTGAAVSAAGTGGSVIDRLMRAKEALGTAGDLGNSIANDEARNRTQRGNWAQQYDRIRLAGNEDDRQMESDAMKKAAQTSYIMGGGNPYQPPKLNSGVAGSFGFGPKAPSEFEQGAAKTLQDQLMQRLSPEGHFKPTPLDSYAKAGTLENIGKGVNYGTAGVNIAKGLWDVFKK